jgi:hypothetical protein
MNSPAHRAVVGFARGGLVAAFLSLFGPAVASGLAAA